MTSRALTVDALIAGGDTLRYSFASPRHRSIIFCLVFVRGCAGKHLWISMNRSPLPPRPADLRSAAACSTERRPCPPSPISVDATDPAITRRPEHLLNQVSASNPSIPFADAPSPPASSASVPNTTRARRRDSGNGSAQVGHRSTPLTEMELMVPTPRAAVAGVAGGVLAGDGEQGSRVQTRPVKRIRSAARAGAPVKPRSSPLTIKLAQ